MSKASIKPPRIEDQSDFWDEETRGIFKSLPSNYQVFLTEYLVKCDAAKAYRVSMNPNASAEVSSSCGSRMLRNASILKILEILSNRRTEALYLVNRTYFEMARAEKIGSVVTKDENGKITSIDAGEVPDWKARAAGNEGLAKIYSLYAPEKVEDDRFLALLELATRKPENA